MGTSTAIEWTDHTFFNPWWGCAKVSPACDHCYAEAWDKRTGGAHWGPHAERRTFGDKHWNEPLRWNAAAEKAEVRRRVFCASMAHAPEGARERLWNLIRETPHLDWQLLTKRPQNIAKMLPADWGDDGYPNVWLGTTVENQAEAERRIPHLLAVPARVRFLSCEPLLGPVDLDCVPWPVGWRDKDDVISDGVDPLRYTRAHLDWVIAGGESGAGARPTNPDWFRDLRDQCFAAGIPFFFKQHGDWADTWAAQIDPALGEGKPYVHVEPLSRQRFTKSSAPNIELRRVGKKAAGALLDGREHKAFPRARRETATSDEPAASANARAALTRTAEPNSSAGTEP
jgi:protein gp37